MRMVKTSFRLTHWTSRSLRIIDRLTTYWRSFSKTSPSTFWINAALSVREFISERADYRNKLLYAGDGGFVTMSESLDILIRDIFSVTLRDLIWCLAVLLSDTPLLADWGLINQFISLYRRV